MSDIFLGVAVGSFMAAYINYRYNDTKWISTKYLVWIGIIALVISVVFGWSDIKKGFKDSTEFGEAVTAHLNSVNITRSVL